MNEAIEGAARMMAVAVVAALLSACSGTTELLGSSMAPAPEPPKMRATRPVRMVALNPIVGPPAPVTERIVQILNEAAARGDIALIVDQSVPSPAALTGYLVTQRIGQTSKLTFVWDIVGPDGARIDRVTGEEVFAAGNATPDVWNDLPQSSLQSMADKVIGAVTVRAPS